MFCLGPMFLLLMKPTPNSSCYLWFFWAWESGGQTVQHSWFWSLSVQTKSILGFDVCLSRPNSKSTCPLAIVFAIMPCFFLSLFYLVAITGVWTHDLTLPRQTFYHLSQGWFPLDSGLALPTLTSFFVHFVCLASIIMCISHWVSHNWPLLDNALKSF
jgi:hypothetical protein